ncbi:type II toxin-antitoxin system VapC family toxin [Benzoatithermus flavus]|uniref:Ribonuclease VapC n=1 Tax=Benzoatithermus flavus TaxID=3108223 RepID=A0ABU8XT99_9PROT
MSYLLDTNLVVAVLRNRPAMVRERLRDVMAEGASVAVPTVVLYELWYGVARSQYRRENTERLRIFLSGDIGIVPFEAEDAAIAGELRAELQVAGSPIEAYDLLIAAQALRTGATLVTANVAEFAHVPGLAWQDWSHEA